MKLTKGKRILVSWSSSNRFIVFIKCVFVQKVVFIMAVFAKMILPPLVVGVGAVLNFCTMNPQLLTVTL